MTKAAIVGASGYMGEELVRLLVRHPEFEITAVTSRTYEGQPLGDVFPRYVESGLTFSNPGVDEIAAEAELVFLALPHGLAAEFAAPLLAAGCRVIDLSADFRVRDPDVYEHYYKTPHPAPELLPQAVYGLPERYRDKIRAARLIASPGCYPTSILVPLLPLLARGLVRAEDILVASASGVSGAGRKVSLEYIFPEANESMRPYAPSGHRHLSEIEQELSLAAGVERLPINFVPHLVPLNRGIHSTIFCRPLEETDAETVLAAWREAYADEPFVRVLPAGKLADTKHVAYTNFIELAAVGDAHTGRLILSAAIDNLTKGGSGQAVQSANILCDYPETQGLS